MLIAIYLMLANRLIPAVGNWVTGLLQPTMLIVITLAGLVIIFGAVGFPISRNLGSTVVNGLFQAIGYVVTLIVQAISWIITSTFRLIPRVFRGSRNMFYRAGINTIVSNLLSVIVTVFVLALII